MTVVSDVPARADGLQLIGEMRGSGYRVPPALVRRGDGQTLQVTPLLYAVLAAVDGVRSTEEVAARVSAATGRTVTAANVRQLVDEQLRPLGLLRRPDGSEPELKRSNPLLALRAKVAVTDPAATRRLTDPFRVLFHPVVWVPVMLGFAVLTWWLLVEKGLASGTYQAFQRPGLLLAIFAVTVLSAGFHEFGHAAAARRGGAQPGVMGAGVYLVWPAFYTDVTDSYRLDRLGRVRTDLGGLYFNAIVAVLTVGAWWLTGWDAVLLVVVAQILQMIRQLAPLVRFDGYHVLADLTGVPDLYSRIGPTLASLWPPRWRDPRATALKPWARAVITAWVLLVVPLLLFTLVTVLLALPRLLGTAWASARREGGELADAVAGMHALDAGAALVSLVAVVFPVLAVLVLLARLARSVGTAAWRRTDGRPLRRGVAGLVALALLALLAWAWWPSPDRYAPVMPWEGGTLTQAVAAPLARAGVALPGATEVQGGRAMTVLPRDAELPTEARPVPALVLVPQGSDLSGGRPSEAGDPAVVGADAPVWVFPFDRPLPPGEGDNQAVAVNTTDGTAVYDVAMAMVWVEDDQVTNGNEAVALARCADCVTVAVAFQVVVIVGSADVVVPTNEATAVNYECFECVTAAVASQLVVSVDALPDAAQQVALADIWEEIAAWSASIPQLSLADILGQLEGYKQELLAILQGDLAAQGEDAADGEPEPSPTTSPSADASADPSASPSSGPSSGPSDSPSGGASQDGSAPAPSPSPSSSSGPSPSPSPDAGPSPSPTPTASG